MGSNLHLQTYMPQANFCSYTGRPMVPQSYSEVHQPDPHGAGLVGDTSQLLTREVLIPSEPAVVSISTHISLSALHQLKKLTD